MKLYPNVFVMHHIKSIENMAIDIRQEMLRLCVVPETNERNDSGGEFIAGRGLLLALLD